MNPILTALNSSKMANSPISKIAQIKNMLTGKNPNEVFNNMLQTNPQFKQFIENNKGKSAEQIAKENGIDLNAIKSIFNP